MSLIATVRAQVERRLPGALTIYERSAPEVIPTGIAAIDHETGGIPKGALTQICGTSPEACPAPSSSSAVSIHLLD
jgi:RecA/RadA recombinase